MRKLFLLRHAKSSHDDVDLEDFSRPLAPRGHKDAKRMARLMAERGWRPSLALVSAALRTRQTWEHLEPRLEGVPVSFEAEIYESTRHVLLERLRKVDDHIASLLLVGHNPGIGRLAETLCGHQGEAEALAGMAEKFPTGALAVIELDMARWGELEAGRGRLAAFIRPRDLDGPSASPASGL